MKAATRRRLIVLLCLFTVLVLANPASAATSQRTRELEDFIDQVSDLHAPSPDKGTHSVFADLQDYGANYDQMTEADQGGAGTDYEDWYKSYTTDIDSYPDVGTETTPENAQDLGDSDYMTIQEADQGGAGGTEWLNVDGYDAAQGEWNSPVGSPPYLNIQDEPANYIYTKTDGDTMGYFKFADTGLSGSGIALNFSAYGKHDDGPTGEMTYLWWGHNGSYYTTGNLGFETTYGYKTYSITGESFTAAAVNSMQFYLEYDKVAGADESYVDYVRMGTSQTGAIDYELDFEYQWTNANFSETSGEEVGILVQTAAQNGENLKAWEWTGSAWASLGTLTSDAPTWNNFTASYLTSGTYYIKVNDTDQAAEGTQSTWSIDSIILHTWTVAGADYELDLEIGWITANYTETNEYLCIFPITGGGWPSEDIKVDVWDGTWTNVFSDLTADQWNNVTVSSYLTDGTFEIRFLGGTEDGDSVQSTWEIDAVLLHTWSLAYTENRYEAMSVVETDSRTASFDRALYESITVDETITTSMTKQKFLFESVAITETLTRAADIVRQFSESITTAETVTNSASILMTLFEALAVAFSLATTKTAQKFLFESITVDDTLMKTITASRNLFESIAVNDTLINTFSIERSFFESVAINDFNTNTLNASKNLFESIAVSDTINNQLIVTKLLFEGIAVNESLTNTLSFSRNLFESIAVNETLTSTISLERVFFESITVNDTVTSSASFSKSLFESIMVNESITKTVTKQMFLFESITVDDTLARTITASRNLFESIAVNDTLTNTFSIERSFFESITISDSNTNTLNASKNLFESIAVSDHIETAKAAQKFLFESIAVNDTVTNSGSMVRVFSEGISTNDTLTRTVDYSRIFYESTGVIETITTTLIAGGVAPVNITAPYLMNPSDSDNMYGRYQFYFINSNVTDADGNESDSWVHYVDIEIWNNAQDTLIWKARFNATSDQFSILQGNTYITLLYSTYWESGTMLNITWSIKIEWAHAEYTDLDAKQFVNDTTGFSDLDSYEVDWDVVTSLDYSVSPALSDDRGDVGTSDLWANGTVVYQGSSLNPLANETDVWVLHDVSGTWSDDLDSSGVFNVTSIESASSVRENTYTFKVVGQGDGSGGTDLYYTTSFTDAFITDRVNVTGLSVDDATPALDQQANFTIYMEYEFDQTNVTTGTWTLNWSLSDYLNMLHVQFDEWNASDVSGSPTTRTYNYINGSCSAYGVTGVNMNSLYVTVEWYNDYMINITLWINDEYMMNGYNTTIYYSGIYHETGEQWNGTATFNTTDSGRFPIYLWYGNYTFNVTAITDPDYGAKQWQIITDLPFCLWEQASCFQIAWEWNTQTGDDEHGEDIGVFLYFYLGQLYWQSNSTRLAEYTNMSIYINGTLHEWAYVGDYGRIAQAYPHLVAGLFDDTWDYVNITIYAEDVWLNGTQYDSLMWNTVLTVQHVLDVDVGPFSDAGAEAVIENLEGQGNVIMIAIYTGDIAFLERAPSGVTVYLNITTGEGTSYNATRVTNDLGVITWSINGSFASTLAGLSDNFTLYYKTNTSLAWVEINRFASVTMSTPTITTEAIEEGIYIDIVPDYTIVSGTQDFGEFAHIVGFESTFLIIIDVYDGTNTWNYTIITDLHRIFLNDILDADANYTITFRHCLQANVIWAECSFIEEIEAKLFITERLFHVGSTELHLSGHVGVLSQGALNASYTVYEGNFVVGSGWVMGDFDLWWDREVGAGDRTSGIKFTRGTQTTWVNVTYSKTGGALSVTVWDIEFDDAYINVFCTTSWGNTTLYFYDNETLQAWSVEAEVIQYRKQGGNGVHVIGVKIDGGITVLWKNFTYSIAIIVADLQLTMFDWDTGSERLVSCTLETNWGNCTVTLTQEGRDMLFSGIETGFGGLSFYFEKTRSETSFTVILTIDGGAQSIAYTLGYSYSAYERVGGPVNNPTNQTIYDAVDDALTANLAGQVVVPPAVFAGLVGLLVIAVAVIIGQAGYTKVKKTRERKKKSGATLAAAFLGG